MTTVSYRPTLLLFVYMELIKNDWNDFLYLFFYIFIFLCGGGVVDNFFNFIWTIILKSESEKIKNVGESFKRVYFYVRLKTNIFYFPVHGQKLCKTFQKLEISHLGVSDLFYSNGSLQAEKQIDEFIRIRRM